MKMKILTSILIIAGVLFTACFLNPAYPQKKGPVTVKAVIVYKTRSDYSRNVPVILSKDKTRLVSYPDVKDIFYNGIYAYPIPLFKGYLLDVKGIGPAVAFLKYTYPQYDSLRKTPSPQNLMNMILEKDPLTEMYKYESSLSGQDLIKKLNMMIYKDSLQYFKKLK